MTDPYAVIDANYDKMYDMVDADDKQFESICEQLLNDKVAIYWNKDGEQMLSLEQVLEDYAEEIEGGMDTKEVIEAEAKRIVESIRG